MFKSSELSVAWIETHWQRMLSSIERNKLGIDWKQTNIASADNCKPLQNQHFQVSVPYIKESLTWEMSFNPLYPELGPDIFLDQQKNSENGENEYLTDDINSLIMWDFANISSLTNLVDELLFRYKNYHLNLIKIHAEKLFDDIQILLNETPLENIEAMLSTRSKQSKLHILVKFQIDQSNSSVDQLVNAWNKILFNFGGSSFSSMTPELYLSPTINNFSEAIDLESIPPFYENQRLIDYVAELKKFVSKKIAAISLCFEKRKQFVISLLVLQYATVLEYDVISYRKVSLYLEHKDFHFILNFVLPLNFPEEKFCLSLHSIYHMNDQGIPFSKTIKNIPYSPRWEPKMMIAKAFKQIFTAEIGAFQDLLCSRTKCR